MTPWTVAHQVPLFMGFPWQEYWNGLPFPSPGDLLDPEIEPTSPAFQADSLPSEPPGKPIDHVEAVISQWLKLPSQVHYTTTVKHRFSPIPLIKMIMNEKYHRKSTEKLAPLQTFSREWLYNKYRGNSKMYKPTHQPIF